jgi:C4-type Zn-finger protein
MWLLIEPREFHVEIHARDRNWRAVVLKSRNDRIELPELDLVCEVGDLYRGTPLALKKE